METINYLDRQGLEALWAKIKSNGATIPQASETVLGGVKFASNDDIDSFLNYQTHGDIEVVYYGDKTATTSDGHEITSDESSYEIDVVGDKLTVNIAFNTRYNRYGKSTSIYSNETASYNPCISTVFAPSEDLIVQADVNGTQIKLCMGSSGIISRKGMTTYTTSGTGGLTIKFSYEINIPPSLALSVDFSGKVISADKALEMIQDVKSSGEILYSGSTSSGSSSWIPCSGNFSKYDCIKITMTIRIHDSNTDQATNVYLFKRYKWPTQEVYHYFGIWYYTNYGDNEPRISAIGIQYSGIETGFRGFANNSVVSTSYAFVLDLIPYEATALNRKHTVIFESPAVSIKQIEGVF